MHFIHLSLVLAYWVSRVSKNILVKLIRRNGGGVKGEQEYFGRVDT
jgi:hypothetical protein